MNTINTLENMGRASTMVAVPPTKSDFFNTLSYWLTKAGRPLEPIVARGSSQGKEMFNLLPELGILFVSTRPGDAIKRVLDPGNRIVGAIGGPDKFVEAGVGDLTDVRANQPASYQPTSPVLAQVELPTPEYWWNGKEPFEWRVFPNQIGRNVLRQPPTVCILRRKRDGESDAKGYSQNEQTSEQLVAELRQRLLSNKPGPVLTAAYPVLAEQWVKAVTGTSPRPGQIESVDGQGESAGITFMNDQGETPLCLDIVSSGASSEAQGLEMVAQLFQSTMWLAAVTDAMQAEKKYGKPEDRQRMQNLLDVLTSWCVTVVEGIANGTSFTGAAYRNSYSPPYTLTAQQRKVITDIWLGKNGDETSPTLSERYSKKI